MRKVFFFASVVSLAAMLFACAAKTDSTHKLVWPPAPDEPKIAFLKYYRGMIDLKEPTFLDMLLGSRLSGADIQKPYGVSAWAEKIYVADSVNATVVIMDTKQQTVSFLPKGPEVVIRKPLGVAVADDGSVFIADGGLGRVAAFNAQGEFLRTFGSKEGMKNPSGLAVNNRLGRLYVVDSRAHTIFVYSLAGQYLFSIGKQGSENGELYGPTNIAVSRASGNVYVVDTNNFRVEIFDPDGKFISKFGELGDVFGTFSRPKGIGVDSEEQVYVADAAFNNFQIFNKDGQLLSYIGDAGRSAGAFQLPAGLFVDSQDRIYVADQVNSRIQVFQYLSVKWKKEHPDEYKAYLDFSQRNVVKSVPPAKAEEQK